MSTYVKVSSYQGKWNINQRAGVIDIQTIDGISHSTKSLDIQEYQLIVMDFNYADIIEFNSQATQYITTKKV